MHHHSGETTPAASRDVIPGLPLANCMLQALPINCTKRLKSEGEAILSRQLWQSGLLLISKLNTVLIMHLRKSPRPPSQNQKVNASSGGAHESRAGLASILT